MPRKKRMPSLGPPGKPKGWIREEEDFDWIDSLPDEIPFSRADYEPLPRAVKPSTWLRIENQNGFGSCQGHSLSSCCEIAYYLATGGDVIQLSRWYAYVGTQIIDGLNGDRGSTISGGATLAKTKGICPETEYPYPKRYTRRISEEQYRKARKYKLSRFQRMRSADDVRNWLDSGLGGISIGVRWGRGGHAIAITETTSSGVKVANSWGTNWGTKGWFSWTWRELKQKLSESYTVAIGMTDMSEVKPRDIDWGLW